MPILLSKNIYKLLKNGKKADLQITLKFKFVNIEFFTTNSDQICLQKNISKLYLLCPISDGQFFLRLCQLHPRTLSNN